MPTITREELHALVWATPMKALALRFGVSDVGLAKICKRLGVQRPPQGYWARAIASHVVSQPALPALTAGQQRAVSFPDLPPPEERAPRLPRPPAPDVPVRDTLAGAHPIVSELGRLLKSQKVDRDGVLAVSCDGQATLRSTPAQKDRVLRILDALIRALVARGHSVDLKQAGSHQHGQRLVVSGNQEALRLSIIERLLRTDHVQTAEEKATERRTGHSWAPKFDHAPSGRLTLELLNLEYSSRLSRWEDSDRRPLERVLGDVVLRVEAKFGQLQEKRRQREEEQRAYRAQQLRNARTAEVQKHEHLLAEDLARMAKSWEEATRIRLFLDAAVPALTSVEASDLTGREEWLEWARTYADQLDPLSRPQLVAKRIAPQSPNTE